MNDTEYNHSIGEKIVSYVKKRPPNLIFWVNEYFVNTDITHVFLFSVLIEIFRIRIYEFHAVDYMLGSWKNLNYGLWCE